MATPDENTLFALTRKPTWIEKRYGADAELTDRGWVYTPTGEVLVATAMATDEVNYFDSITSAAPAGTITFDTVNPGSTTVDIEFSYDSDDALRFEYRVDGGEAIDLDGLPEELRLDRGFTVEGLTAETTYTVGHVQVRAFNVSGTGNWQDVPEFTTTA